jgi:organic radical activating enzyme
MASRILYGSEIHSDWAYEKMQRPATVLTVAMNFSFYLLGVPRIRRVFSVVVEPVLGCNLRCATCWAASWGLEQEKPRLMSWELYRKIVDQLPAYVETITLSLGGEPLLHPRIQEMIDYGADSGKRMVLFTNGTLLTGERLRQIAASRLAVLNVSGETDSDLAREIRGTDQDAVRANVERFLAAKRPDTEVKLSLVLHERNVDRLGNVQREWGRLVTHVKVSPSVRRDPAHSTRVCVEPWRGNLNILSNGLATPCCFDIGGSLAVGDFNRQTFDQIAYGAAYRELLRRFLAGNPPSRCGQCSEFQAVGVPTRLLKKKR